MFRVSTSQTALTSSLMMSGPNSPNHNPLNYQVWGNTGILTQAATEAKQAILTDSLRYSVKTSTEKNGNRKNVHEWKKTSAVTMSTTNNAHGKNVKEEKMTTQRW